MIADRPLTDYTEIRNFHRSDEAFIYSTWLKLYRIASPHTRHIPKTLYYENQKMIVTKLLGRSSHKFVASAIDDKEIVYGYLIGHWEEGRPGTLHFMYVKSSFRNFGIGQLLLKKFHWDPTICEVSHWTNYTEKYSKSHPSLIYNPYSAMGFV